MGWSLHELFLDIVHQKIPGFITGQDIDTVVEFDPRQDVGMMLIRRNVDGWLGILLLQGFYQLDCLLNCASRAAASRKGHKIFLASTKGFQEAVVGVVHHLGGIL